MGALTKYLINNKIFPTPDNVIKIKPTHIFVDELARNAYFILNPSARVPFLGHPTKPSQPSIFFISENCGRFRNLL